MPAEAYAPLEVLYAQKFRCDYSHGLRRAARLFVDVAMLYGQPLGPIVATPAARGGKCLRIACRRFDSRLVGVAT
jgi:hypothetical protein